MAQIIPLNTQVPAITYMGAETSTGTHTDVTNNLIVVKSSAAQPLENELFDWFDDFPLKIFQPISPQLVHLRDKLALAKKFPHQLSAIQHGFTRLEIPFEKQQWIECVIGGSLYLTKFFIGSKITEEVANAINEKGNTALMEAILNPHFLIDDVHFYDTDIDTNGLKKAVSPEEIRIQFVTNLLKIEGTNINFLNSAGESALNAALRTYDIPLVTLLLDHGAQRGEELMAAEARNLSSR